MTQARRTFPPWLALVVLVLSTTVCPGLTGWVNDEPILMEMALRYNRTSSDIYGVTLPFTPSPFGLLGTRGARYGPLPVWVDQLFLVFTHSIAAMIALRAVLVSALIALALYKLSRTLELSPWFAVITLFSPWLWLFSRSLWDSTWCIPISAGLFSAYAAFLRRPSGIALCFTLICALLLPTVHLMSIAMVLPVAIHLLFFHRRDLWKWKWSLCGIAAVGFFLFRPYLLFFLTHTYITGFENQSKLLGWLFPLLGGHYLTLGVAGTIPGDGWQQNAPAILVSLVSLARWISRLPLLAVWLGMILAIGRARRALRFTDAYPQEHLCLISLAVWFCQTILDGLERLYFSPHYYAATWIVYTFFAWIAVDWLIKKSRAARATTFSLLGACAASILLGMSIIFRTIAQNSGTQGILYGPSLNNQIQAIQKIQQFSDRSAVDIQFPNWQKYPLAMKVLMELNPPPPSPRPVAHLTVKYRNAYPGDARIAVEQTN
jgi:hypothetical protein